MSPAEPPASKREQRIAEEAIDTGKALELLHKMVEMNGDYGKLVRFL